METKEEPIHYDGVLVGYRRYAKTGIFGSWSFTGYRWLTPA